MVFRMKSAMLFSEKCNIFQWKEQFSWKAHRFSSCKIMRFRVITKYRSFVYNGRRVECHFIYNERPTKIFVWHFLLQNVIQHGSSIATEINQRFHNISDLLWVQNFWRMPYRTPKLCGTVPLKIILPYEGHNGSHFRFKDQCIKRYKPAQYPFENFRLF